MLIHCPILIEALYVPLQRLYNELDYIIALGVYIKCINMHLLFHCDFYSIINKFNVNRNIFKYPKSGVNMKVYVMFGGTKNTYFFPSLT